mgnify:CR=1 FL=1
MRETETPSSFEKIGTDIFETIARYFPVAAASDEFYYFPQVQPQKRQWHIWDLFSTDAVEAAGKELLAGEAGLEKLTHNKEQLPRIDPGTRIDISLLHRVTRTLIDQLIKVRAWESQPTWHLTIACIGLAEAIESEDPAAGHHRAEGLADYLDQAGRALKNVPALFRELGLEMVAGTRKYFLLLKPGLPELKYALSALDRFEETLRHISPRSNFLLPRKLVRLIVHSHLNCCTDLEELENILDKEIQEMRRFIATINGQQVSGSALEAAISAIPHPRIGAGGLLELYREEVERLGRHCLEKRLVSSELYRSCPVRVQPVPSFLSATRTASSYSIPPGHPPTGGMFYVINTDRREESGKGYQREYKILSAHETYPGHHLLDIHRWSLKRPFRRAVELPVFYEGWACFSEEIMRLTGYFKAPHERLLLARRRLWRAIRGKIDLGLQTGSMGLAEAARYLVDSGVPDKDAKSIARKYPLNPGYQLCYTVGIRRFLDFFDRWGRKNLQRFVMTVLTQGEIGFDNLEKVLEQDMGNHE